MNKENYTHVRLTTLNKIRNLEKLGPRCKENIKIDLGIYGLESFALN